MTTEGLESSKSESKYDGPCSLAFVKMSDHELIAWHNAECSRRGSRIGTDLATARRELLRRRKARKAGKWGELTIGRMPLLFRNKVKNPDYMFLRGLPPRYEKFCAEYVATGDAQKAYVAAGFSAKNPQGGSRLLKNPHIQARLEDYRGVVLRKMEWDVRKVLEGLGEVFNEAKDHKDYTNANRALENVAKHLGMFIERTKQDINITGSEKPVDVKEEIAHLADVAGLKIVEGGKK